MWNLQKAVGGTYTVLFEVPADADQVALLDELELELYKELYENSNYT